MPTLTVFPDTGALVSMDVFPRDRHGRLSLAGEVLQLYAAAAFDIMLGRVVADELEEVIDRNFPQTRSALVAFLSPFVDQLLRWPTLDEIRALLPVAEDPDDAPIMAGALAAQPDIVLSNDCETFHTPRAKEFWARHGIQVESLYGLLCVFGRRDRKAPDG